MRRSWTRPTRAQHGVRALLRTCHSPEAAGHSNQEIAHRLHLGVTTVKTHVGSLMAKTGTPNRIRLAGLAVRAGIAGDRQGQATDTSRGSSGRAVVPPRARGSRARRLRALGLET